ncbi:MAG TPA: ABC transporter ATP-binding protein [Candidatus Thiothrix moscowensis]|uniref:ABC transporter ATP-binding protein n=1 Tax=unclassified Thiothrix TaxID=2636184 RepID=UPI0025F6FDFC|nr:MULTISPECIES: ABC transporter ATP-binding protein [unclassified Thiothrix]HRJ52664.1 ABC transporter ATP-binding protein [Candidatus Thiothrix moscowensis]HRJ92852.1 ABC transporter ATP-binding protein [Candidatus Thiothrix moscowensis]
MSFLTVYITDKTYTNGVQAIRDLHFQVAKGEFVALVAPSGAGKSTLLNLLAGLDTDFQGKLAFPADASLSFMFQEPRLLPWLTVEDNIRLVLDAPARHTDLTRFARMDLLLQQLGLQDFRQLYPNQLSGGMKRRAALVRAFVTRPAVLLMDEPFQSLDEPTAQGLRQLLLQLWAEHHPTVLFVTHSLNEALLLADRILFLSARPAQVVLDYTVPLPRPRPQQLSELQALQTELLQRFPQLLSGSGVSSQPFANPAAPKL